MKKTDLFMKIKAAYSPGKHSPSLFFEVLLYRVVVVEAGIVEYQGLMLDSFSLAWRDDFVIRVRWLVNRLNLCLRGS